MLTCRTYPSRWPPRSTAHGRWTSRRPNRAIGTPSTWPRWIGRSTGLGVPTRPRRSNRGLIPGRSLGTSWASRRTMSDIIDDRLLMTELESLLSAYVVEMKWPDLPSRRFRVTLPDGQYAYYASREGAVAVLWRQGER